jgi:hypothetical protein
MLTFNYYAYRMMELRKLQTFIVIYQPLTPPPPVYETVLAFEDAWMECLGHLGRYRIAIEDDDVRDREVWQRFFSRSRFKWKVLPPPLVA